MISEQLKIFSSGHPKLCEGLVERIYEEKTVSIDKYKEMFILFCKFLLHKMINISKIFFLTLQLRLK